MCVPGTIEAVRSQVEQVEEEAKAPRLDRRTALLLGAGTALAAALPGGARAAGRAAGRQGTGPDASLPRRDTDVPGCPPASRQTHVTVPVNGFYGQIWNFWEHTGTHLDVPAHFIVGGRTTPQLTLDELMAPIAVIDISERAARNPDTVVTTDDLRRYERGHGKIKRGSLVAMNSGCLKTNGSLYLADLLEQNIETETIPRTALNIFLYNFYSSGGDPLPLY